MAFSMSMTRRSAAAGARHARRPAVAPSGPIRAPVVQRKSRVQYKEDDVRQAAKDVKEDVKSGLSKAGESIKEGVQNVKDSAKDLGAKAKGTAQEVQADAQGAAESAKGSAFNLGVKPQPASADVKGIKGGEEITPNATGDVHASWVDKLQDAPGRNSDTTQLSANKENLKESHAHSALKDAQEIANQTGSDAGRAADRSQQFGNQAILASEKDAEGKGPKGIKQDNANWGSVGAAKGPSYDPNADAGKADPV